MRRLHLESFPELALRGAALRHYREMIAFLGGADEYLGTTDFAIAAVLARRSFLNCATAWGLVGSRLSAARLEAIAARDPSFACELMLEAPANSMRNSMSARVSDDLCISQDDEPHEVESLATLVLDGGPECQLRNELAALRFAGAFLGVLARSPSQYVIAPGQVLLHVAPGPCGPVIEEIAIRRSQARPDRALYGAAPEWVGADERWRFQLGYLLRFIFGGKPDFTHDQTPSLEGKRRHVSGARQPLVSAFVWHVQRTGRFWR